MPPILKFLLPIIAVIVLLVIGFQIHPLLGIGFIIILIGGGVYANRAVIYATRANVVFSRGDEDQAMLLLEKAYQTKRAMPQHMIGYGFLLNKKGQPEKAEQLLKELLARPLPDAVRIQVSVNLATSYWIQGRKEEACELLEEYYPQYENTQLYGTLGYYRLLRGDDPEAVLAFNKEAYEYNSDDLMIMDNLAQNYYFLGRFEEAKAMYEKVMEKRPKSADSYYFYALTLQALGMLDEAKEQIVDARARNLAQVTPLTQADIDRLATELGV